MWSGVLLCRIVSNLIQSSRDTGRQYRWGTCVGGGRRGVFMSLEEAWVIYPVLGRWLIKIHTSHVYVDLIGCIVDDRARHYDTNLVSDFCFHVSA